MRQILRSPLPLRWKHRVPPLLTEFLVALAIATLLGLLRLSLQPLLADRAPFAFVFVGVAVATILAGWRCGVLTLIGGQTWVWFAVLEPQWSFRPKDGSDVDALLIVTASELALLLVIILYQREVRRAWAARDETDRARELLVNELNHRVKNTLAVVQGLASQSLRGTDGAAAQSFSSRLMAYARAHDLLAEQSWNDADIRSVVDAALRPYRPEGSGAITVTGPDIKLAPRLALNLTLVLNELATNAVKYGALSTETGRVHITWEALAENLRIKWIERGGPPVTVPQRKGFGHALINQALSADASRDVDLDFAPTGLICTMNLRLSEPEQTAQHID